MSSSACRAVLLLQVYLDRKLAAAGKQPVAIGALLFAPPNVGDDTFVTDFNKKVNARRIAYVADIVPQVPCAPRMMACRNTIFQTAAPGVTSWNYGKVCATWEEQICMTASHDNAARPAAGGVAGWMRSNKTPSGILLLVTV